MLKKNKGFTMVEMLVAIAILGIILALAIPGIRKVQSSNTDKKIKEWENAVISNSKLYVEQNKKDVFDKEYIEDNQHSQCTIITVSDLKDQALKEYTGEKNISCQDTKILIIKQKEKYIYKINVTCINSKNDITTYNKKEFDEDDCIGNQIDNNDIVKVPDTSTAEEDKEEENKEPTPENKHNKPSTSNENKNNKPSTPGENNNPPTEKNEEPKDEEDSGLTETDPEDSYESSLSDHEIPTITIVNPSADRFVKNASVIITIKDNTSLSDRVSFKYGWTNNPTASPDAQEEYIFYDSFGKNELETILQTPSNLNGDYYLWIQPVNISDSSGNCINNILTSQKIKLDNTPPEIKVTNPYSNKWAGIDVINNESYQLLIEAKDNQKITQYKYSYPDSSNQSERETKNYDLVGCNREKTCSYSTDLTTFTTTPFIKDRNERVIITVCDEANNCANGSTIIKIDSTAPKIVSSTLKENNMNGANYNSENWINKDVYLNAISEDVGSGNSKFQYSYNNINWTDINSFTTFTEGNPNVNFDMFIKNEGIYTVYLRAIDSVGNIGTSYNVGKVKIDKTPPSIQKIENPYQNIWANKQLLKDKLYQLDISATDQHSGIKEYKYSYPNSNIEAEKRTTTYDLKTCKETNVCDYNDNLTRFKTTPFTKERNESVKITVCDHSKNCSEQTTTIKIDTTAPSKPTLNMTYNFNNNKPEGQKASLYENNTTTSNDIFMADKRWSNFADINTGGPKSQESGSGIKNYEISSDGVNYSSYRYSESDSLYKITNEGVHKRYIRAIDNALNVSEVREYTITKAITPEPPTIPISCPDITATTISGGSAVSKSWINEDVELFFDIPQNLEYDLYLKKTTDQDWVKKKTAIKDRSYVIETQGKLQAKIVIRNSQTKEEKECYSEQYYIDKTAPKCTNSGGSATWTNKSVTLTGTCIDETNGSGCRQATITKQYNYEINSTKESPGQIFDNAGNKANCAADQTVRIDKTSPTVTIKAYKMTSSNTKEGNVIAEATVNNNVKSGSIQSYQNTVNGWLNKTNYPNGVYYEVSYLDNYGVNQSIWSWNQTGKSTDSCKNNSCLTGGTRNRSSSDIKIEDFSLSGEGYRLGIYTLTDMAGNSVSINITAPIDRTSPTSLTSETRTGSSTGTVIANTDSWTNKTLWWGNFKATESISQIDHFEFSTNCTNEKTNNLLTSGYTYGATNNTYENRKYCFRAVDKAGNTSNWSNPHYFKIDKIAPKLDVVFKKWSDEKTEPQTLSDTEYNKLSNYKAYPETSKVLWSDKKIATKATATDAHSGEIKYYYTTTGTTTASENVEKSKRNIEASGTSTIQYKACDAVGNCTISPKYYVKIAPLAVRKIIKYNTNDEMIFNGKISDYKTNINLYNNKAMQSFAIDHDNNDIYISQQQYTSKGAYFSKVNLGAKTLTGTTILKDFGHAAQIDLQTASNGTKYLWTQCAKCRVKSNPSKFVDFSECEASATKNERTKVRGVCRVEISSMDFNSTTPALDSITKIDIYESDYTEGKMPLTNSDIERVVPGIVAIDEDKNTLVALTGDTKNHYYTVYELDSFIKLMNGKITTIEAKQAWTKNYSKSYNRQGIEVKGNYIYSWDGHLSDDVDGGNDVFLSVFTLDGETVVNRLPIGYPSGSGIVWEPEGIKVYDNIIHVGYVRGIKNSSGDYTDKNASIYKLISK